jgi:hypothetical protein
MTNLVVDYYFGSYGKTIYIRVEGMEHLLFLKELFHRLATTSYLAYRLSEGPNVLLSGIREIVLSNGEASFEASEFASNDVIFWKQRQLDWYNSEGLIDGLMLAKGKGHQYFPLENQEILVEIDKLFDEK